MTNQDLPEFISPNDMMTAAKNTMLDGRELEEKKDWYLLANFIAANTGDGLECSILTLFKVLYKLPIPDHDITEIAEFQAVRKEGVA